jgi:hypothetical protein
MNSEFVLEHFFFLFMCLKFTKEMSKLSKTVLFSSNKFRGSFKVFIFLCLWPEGGEGGVMGYDKGPPP